MKPDNYSALVITELFAPTKGGTAVWFDQVYRRLGGGSVHILTASAPEVQEADRRHPNSIHRVRLERVRWLRPESLILYWRLLWGGFKIAWRHRPLQYHAGRVLPEGLVALSLARLFRKPCLIYAHGEEITTWRTPIKSRVMSWVYRHTDIVIANSEFTQQRLIDLGVDQGSIRLIHPGVKTEQFQEQALPSDLSIRNRLPDSAEGCLLVSVGRLSRRKGFDTMIEVTARLRAAGVKVHYAIAGIGEDEQYLQTMISNKKLSDSVTLLGAVDEEDLPALYRSCDLFVMPNREVDGDVEGFGMVYLEAAACGKASISGLSGGVVSAVRHMETGLNCDGDSVDSVFDGVFRLLNDKKLRGELANNAHQRAHRDFSWNAVAANTYSIFNPAPLDSRQALQLNDIGK
ncbi:glycosyltransferase family 4 protein [Aestuariirhabdus sp. LZHN29]|uniref:glycosyltransferase family 4 protein n=1 Tax=Aestuariirhabdus sp. LZHN29 TaxID=3417462 RepID=UPI003CF5C3E9